MDSQTQEKVSRLLRDQAEKLGKAKRALNAIKKLKYNPKASVLDAIEIANDALREIAENGENTQDL